jgi:hypothetical protein
MEPEVHLVALYMQLVKKCFVMNNLMINNGKELDLLAYDPITKEKYHIEVHVITGKGFRIRLIDTQKADGTKHKIGMDTLNSLKFSPPAVVDACTKIFGCSTYRKVLVVWSVREPSLIEQAKILYGIETWLISDLITELMQKIGAKGYRDDILRIVQLISMRNPAI